MNVYAVSDIHADHEDNRSWLTALPTNRYRRDILLVAGDVSHKTEVLKATLGLLRDRFFEVFFVPGNHDLWVTRKDRCNSLDKFFLIQTLCDELGVRTRRGRFDGATARVEIVPLFSWYSMPRDGSDTLYMPEDSMSSVSSAWADFHLIDWPDKAPNAMCEFFLRLNEQPDVITPKEDIDVITFSHFLPRKELVVRTLGPRQTSASSFNFSAVAGTLGLERQIRREGASIHVYGHQHRNVMQRIDGVTYVECAVGYAAERTKGQLPHAAELPISVWTDDKFFADREGL